MARILIVEDDTGMNQLYCAWLAQEHECQYAASVAEALSAVSRTTYGLLVLDYRLPDGSGLDILAAMREQALALPPVLLVTGYGTYTLSVEALDVGVTALAAKPLDRPSFLRKVRTCLALGRSALTLRDDRFQRLEAHLLENLHRKVSLEEVAHLASASRSAFNRWIKRASGHSYTKLVSELRLREARALLSDGDLSVGEVAERTGFRSQSYFARWFKRHTGLSPRRYRDGPRGASPVSVGPQSARNPSRPS